MPLYYASIQITAIADQAGPAAAAQFRTRQSASDADHTRTVRAGTDAIGS